MTKYATAFPPASALTGAELLQLVQSGADVQSSVSSILGIYPPSQNNLLINADGQINQSVFAGGALSAGVYGYDMHKAGTGGCNVSVSALGVWTHTSGPVVQILELPQLASQIVTASVYDPTGTVTINIDGVSGNITAGSGQRSVTITVPSGSTGNVTYTRTATGVTYSRPKLERGAIATPWNPRSYAIELDICQRYYEKTFVQSVAPANGTTTGTTTIAYAFASTAARSSTLFQVTKRAIPNISFYRSNEASGAAGMFNYFNAGAWATATTTAATSVTDRGFNIDINGTGFTSGGTLLISGQWIADCRL